MNKVSILMIALTSAFLSQVQVGFADQTGPQAITAPQLHVAANAGPSLKLWPKLDSDETIGATETADPHTEAPSSFLRSDPRFSWEDARAAFLEGRAPTAEDLAGKWMLIGYVSVPPSEDLTEGYFPDGRFRESGYSGYFRGFRQFSLSDNAFGGSSLSLTFSVVGAESGKIYRTLSAGVNLGSLEARWREVSNDQGDPFCGNLYRCRMLKNGMLLCGLTMIDHRDFCGQYSSHLNRIWSFEGYIKVQ